MARCSARTGKNGRHALVGVAAMADMERVSRKVLIFGIKLAITSGCFFTCFNKFMLAIFCGREQI
jgi:hypothetical protein